MRRRSTLQAAAAALGLVAGFAMAPASHSPLDQSVTPYTVSVAWRAADPAPPSAVQAAELRDRLLARPPLPAAERPVRIKPMRARASLRGPAPERPSVARRVELVSTSFTGPERECPRHRRQRRES